MAKEQILKNEAIKEILKCGDDPIYFITNYCKIRHPVRGLVPFKLYEYQENSIKAILAYNRIIINKARQLGFSTVVAAFIAWLILFHNDQMVLIIANKQDVAKNTLAKVKLILSHIPTWMYLADLTENNVHTISLTNGSSVKSIASSGDAGRSEAVSLLVLDEAAHIDNMDELWKGAASTVSTGGKVVALSTPKGISNWFHEYFTKAESGEIDWHPIITHWWENPDYAEGIEPDPISPGGFTSPWFRKTTEGWSRQQIAQELLTSFIETGDNFFSVETMEFYDKLSFEPIEKRFVDGNLWIWKKPVYGYKYLVAADVCHGAGEDYSSAYVIELKDLEFVAEYKGKIPPDLFGDFLVELATEYNNAYLCPENQSVGLSTCLHIKNLGYRNLCYFDKDTGRLIDQWTAEYKGIHPGQPMTVKERPMVLAKLEEFLRKNLIKSYSKRFVRELQTFIVKNGKPQAEKGTNDDLIMAAAIGIWVRDICPEFRGSVAALDMIKAISATKKNTTEYQGPSSKNFQIQQHKEKVKKMLDMQKVPIGPNNPYASYIYKIR